MFSSLDDIRPGGKIINKFVQQTRDPVALLGSIAQNLTSINSHSTSKRIFPSKHRMRTSRGNEKIE
jgi:hypothetical protein